MRLRRLTDSQLLGRNDALGFELMNAREPRQKSFPNSEIRHSRGRGTAEARFVRVVRSSPQRASRAGSERLLPDFCEKRFKTHNICG
jgi:hypothetical protein